MNNNTAKIVLDDNNEYKKGKVYVSRRQEDDGNYFFITVPEDFLPDEIHRSHRTHADNPKRLSRSDFDKCLAYIDKKLSKYLDNQMLPYLDTSDRMVPCCKKEINRIGIVMPTLYTIYEEIRTIVKNKPVFVDRVDSLFDRTLTYDYMHSGFMTIIVVQYTHRFF